jgi:hypothetical protein
VSLLVERVPEVEAPQERILGDFRGAREIAPAVGLGFGEGQELATAPIGVAKNETVNRREKAFDGVRQGRPLARRTARIDV